MPPIPELEEIRRKQIIDATLLTLSKLGYAKATMADIAKAANMSKGGLAHYFKSKHDLFKAAFTNETETGALDAILAASAVASDISSS